MKRLIVCIVIDNKYREVYLDFCLNFLKSLRGKGQYSQDVRLYTNGSTNLVQHAKFADIYSFTFKDLPGPQWSRSYLGSKEDFSAYDQVSMIDVDIEMIASIEPHLIGEGKFIQFEQGSSTYGKQKEKDYYGWELIRSSINPELREIYARTIGFNGSLVCATPELLKKFCIDWWDNRLRNNPELLENDQPIANWVIRTLGYRAFSIPMPWKNYKGSMDLKQKILRRLTINF